MTSLRDWVDEIADATEEPLMTMDGYDDCIVGLCRRNEGQDVVIYSLTKVLAKLVADGMSHEEAVEFHEFNQLGAYVGPGTPVFLVTPD